MKRLYAVICTLLIAVSSTYAAEKSVEGKLFKKLDKDKNGMISQKEAGKRKDLTEDWAKYDTNKDGQLDMKEFTVYVDNLPESPEPED